jgi:hypothetical protein
MIKKALVLATALAIVAAACGDGDAQAPATSAPPGAVAALSRRRWSIRRRSIRRHRRHPLLR